MKDSEWRRCRWRAILACFFGAALGATTAAEAAETKAHAHGNAELRIVVDGPRLDVSLETPLDNMLGFEHAPRTDKQREAVRTMAAKLRNPQLFRPTAAARCQPVSTTLQSAVLPAALLGEDAGAPAAETKPAASAQSGPKPDTKDEEAHADLDAAYAWHCEAPSELKGLDVGLMQAFPRMTRMDVQIVGPRGQSAARLTAGKRAVAW